jgi:leader peptidase (prepilin peptidase)/N-methyltransferase
LAAVGGALGFLVGWQVGWTPALAAWAALSASCLVLGYVDARTRLLPTQLIAPSYWVIIVLLLGAAVIDGSFAEVKGAFLGWVVMGGFYYVLWRLGPGLGYGDVRLSGLLALCLGFLGWGQLVTGLYSGFLLAGVASAILLVAKRASLKTQLPFGPYMMLGALAGLVWGQSLSGWYTSR